MTTTGASGVRRPVDLAAGVVAGVALASLARGAGPIALLAGGLIGASCAVWGSGVASPLADAVPPVDAAGTHWCVPELLVDVTYLARTPAGRLRQPVVRGVRTDAPADPWEVP